MSRTRFLSWLVIGLLLTNILLVGFIVLRQPGSHVPRMPREIIIERLNFTNEQVIAYDGLINWHRSEIRKADDQILALKTHLYSGISGKISQVHNDSLIAEISKLQVRVEGIHYKHFRDIRNLCTPGQQPYFEELLKDIASIFYKPKKGPRTK